MNQIRTLLFNFLMNVLSHFPNCSETDRIHAFLIEKQKLDNDETNLEDDKSEQTIYNI